VEEEMEGRLGGGPLVLRALPPAGTPRIGEDGIHQGVNPAPIGTGLGANHQSWTTIVANLIAQQIEDQVHERTEQMI
jgi:hypothetical protein